MGPLARIHASFDASSFAFLSRPARMVVVLLVVSAIAFCIGVVAWDVAASTTTSTEPLVLVIAGFPLLIAVAVVASVDYVVTLWRRRAK